MTATAAQIRAAARTHAERTDGPTVHLQGIGRVPAARVADLAPGTTLMWNYGTTTTVLSSTQDTSTMWTLVEPTREGQILSGRKRGTTLVGLARRSPA